jgi:hypothetical protein
MRIGEVHVHVDVLQAVRLAGTMLSTKLQQSADYFALHANQAVFNNQKKPRTGYAAATVGLTVGHTAPDTHSS